MITIYTDGSCRRNGYSDNIGAWGFIVYNNDESMYTAAARVENTSNNRCEMTAIIEALKWMIENNVSDAVICTDSALCFNGITQWLEGWKTRGWKKSDKTEVLNKDLWVELDQLIQRRPNVIFQKVKGHQNDAKNNEIDKLVQGLSKE